ncbi:MAG TPA: hypothetical protein VFG13_05030, partial [Blastococcus sp.]|nr:hypothetical protein [Blastococcus sp.]
MSDAVTWWVCPRCGGPAALGWVERRVAEIDCSAGCRLTEEQLAAVRLSVASPQVGPGKSA